MSTPRPGKTAPRLLQDLLTYDPRREHRQGRNLLTSAPPQHDPDGPRLSAVSSKNCKHTLMRKDEQTHVPQSHNDFDRSFTYQVASFCNKCRWHFDVLIGFFHHVSERTLCGKANKDFPMHHFLFNGEKDEPVIDGIQSNSRTFSFQCSAPHCPIGLRIRVTPPRLTEEDVVLLTDQKVLRRRWEDAKRIDKNRAEDAMARRVDPVDFLNTYLQDSLNPVKGKTCIPFLNRKFLKTFGKDCDAILKKLGFTNVVELDAKGESTEVWYLPTPPAAQYPMEIKEPTPSERTVVDDARYELNTILLSFPEAERLATRRAPLDLAPSFGDIEELLGCADYVKAAGRATRSSNDAEDHPYYAGLGTVGDFADHYLLFAYHRQSTTDPSNAPYYFECIQDLAYGRQSNLLQQDVATLASEGRLSRREIFTAFRYFNIDTEQRETVSDDYIIGLFKSRLADIAPSMVGETRKHLRTIGYARDSESITRAASDTIETYEQALMWLDLDETQTDDLVIALSASKDDDPSSKEIARKAVDIIARHRNSQTLRDYLENSNMADYEQDVSDAYNFLNIADKRTSTIDLHVLESTVEVEKGLWPGNEKKYTNALRIVREDQEKMNINRQPKPQYPLATWPVGCSNIGNTCYLNSVLQFLFTIKPLRKMVLECEDYMQELTPEALETKKVGRTVVSLGRAETGQHFVRELRKLFEQMITAAASTIRPEKTLAILALTKSTLNAENTSDSGTNGENPIIGPMTQVQALQDSKSTPLDSTMGHCDDAKSDPDSMKAMDLTDSPLNDAKPERPSRPPPIPPRPQDKFQVAEEVARQQDAAEAITNVFDLLSCAFEANGTLRDNEQNDIVKDLFFADVTTVRMSSINSEKTSKTSKTDLQDTIFVTPGDRDRKLCAALDDEFGLSEAEPGITKYEFFERPPPIQIFYPRRLQFDPVTRLSSKNETHLALEKVMYMDRYMGSTPTYPGKQLPELRKKQWRLQDELRILKERRKSLKETDYSVCGNQVDLPAVLEETAALIEGLGKERPDLSPETIKRNPDAFSDHLRQRAEVFRPQIQEIDDLLSQLEKEIDSVFSQCQDHPYRLHAIFMHAGTASGGHYWIYIYDFQKNIWRKYNDEFVTEETEENILNKVEGIHPATSTGIVYVQDEYALEYTEAVCRQIMESGPGDGVDSADIVMKDAEIPVINGVEVA